MRVAVAGTRFFSQFHFDAWSRLDVDVVGICSLDHDVAGLVAKDFPDCQIFEDFAEMLTATSPNLVDIVTPPPTHLTFVTQALRNGVATICQNPFCGSLDDATKVADIATETGVPLIVHENFCFQPWYGEIKAQLGEGALGDVYQGTFRLRPGDGQAPSVYLDRRPYF